MTLIAGRDYFVNGIPYRFISFVWKFKHKQKWIAMPLFVSNNAVELIVSDCDNVHESKLHGGTHVMGR